MTTNIYKAIDLQSDSLNSVGIAGQGLEFCGNDITVILSINTSAAFPLYCSKEVFFHNFVSFIKQNYCKILSLFSPATVHCPH